MYPKHLKHPNQPVLFIEKKNGTSYQIYAKYKSIYQKTKEPKTERNSSKQPNKRKMSCRYSMHQNHDPANAGKPNYMNVASLPALAMQRHIQDYAALPSLTPTCGINKPTWYGQGCSTWTKSACPSGTNLNPAGACVPPFGEEYISPAFSSASSCIGTDFNY